ncbi:MAG: hypothetical protein COA62_03150 [Rhodobiaceae bacterium]|nr:MAG: hypothetical protein COA62_03150 [Rhodobiaceae bacterium]
MKRFFLSISAIIVIVTGGLLALTFVDIDEYKPEIEKIVEDLTGRTLRLEGTLHIGFSLTPVVVIEDVYFGNAKWGSQEDMFTAERVVVKLSLLSLLVGDIDVRRLTVSGAKLLLETGPQGDGNWDFAGGGDEAAAGADATILNSLPHVVIEDLQLVYKIDLHDSGTEVFFERADIEPRGDGFGIGFRGALNSRIASFNGFLQGDARAFSIGNLQVGYDGLSLTGKLNGTLPGAGRPIEIDGELVADEISLDRLLDVPATSETPTDDGLFSDTPLPFDFLDVVDGQVDVSIDHLSYRSFGLTDVHAVVALEDGALNAPIFANYMGSRFEARFTATSGSRSGVTVTLNAPGLDIGQVLKEIDATDLVDVRGHVGLDLSARGRSVKALMSSLNGKIDIATGRGIIDSDAFELVAEDLLWALIPKGGDADTAELTCFIGELDFAEGVGEVAALALVTDKIRTSGEGTINLGTEQIDLTLHPHPNDPGFLSLATPVLIVGALADPSVSPDAGSLLADLAVAVGAGLLTGGVGAILPLISTENFDAESAGACMEVIAGSRGGDAGVLEGAVDGAGGLVRGVGDILTSPFD